MKAKFLMKALFVHWKQFLFCECCVFFFHGNKVISWKERILLHLLYRLHDFCLQYRRRESWICPGALIRSSNRLIWFERFVGLRETVKEEHFCRCSSRVGRRRWGLEGSWGWFPPPVNRGLSQEAARANSVLFLAVVPRLRLLPRQRRLHARFRRQRRSPRPPAVLRPAHRVRVGRGGRRFVRVPRGQGRGGGEGSCGEGGRRGGGLLGGEVWAGVTSGPGRLSGEPASPLQRSGSRSEGKERKIQKKKKLVRFIWNAESRNRRRE